jgi:hypothetical protein
MEETWYTLEDINPSSDDSTLYCIAVDSPDKQFLAGNIGVPTHNTEAGKADDELKGEASMILGSIARLGRAAGVHIIAATQRPDAKILAGETKANLGVRINCGRTDSNASSMILGNSEGTRVKANPRGRLYIRIYGSGDHGQGFFADPSWIDNYLASQGLNPDGSPLTQKKSRLANVTDMSNFDGTDLDSREGIDNSAIIERIRSEESSDDFESIQDDEDDWEFQVDFDETSEETSEETHDDPNWVRPQMGVEDNSRDKWHRPEEDWDPNLEALIAENFKE